MVIWITGLSGAGKTTVCQTIMSMAKESVPELVMLDGDAVREIFDDQLGHSEPDRVRQIKRIQRLARELDAQGLVVLVAALYAHPKLLTWNRENFDEYFEVYLDVSLDVVESRDPKGLYAKARAGEMKHVVGLDIPWLAPSNPNLQIDMSEEVSPREVSNRIIENIPALSVRMVSAAYSA